jgi:Domain of unknown function (DUF4394)
MKRSYLLGAFASLSLTLASTGTSLFGVTSDNRLVTFDSASPSVFQSSVTISGLFGSDGLTPNPSGSILNLTARITPTPGDFQLFGIDDNANIYTINLGGVASLVSSSFSPNGYNSGLAYDVINDSLVYAGDNSENFSLSIAGAVTINPDFTYAGGGTPAIFGLGVDPFFGTAFAIDALNDQLSTSGQITFPTGSELDIVGGLGLNVTAFGGLTVDFDGNLIASLSEDGVNSSLYSIDSTTGAATSLGSFGAGVGVVSVAVPGPSAALLGAFATMTLLRRRRL